MAPKTPKGAERQAYMKAYAKGVNKGNRMYGAKKVDVGESTRAASGRSLGANDPGQTSQGSPGQGSPTQYGKTSNVLSQDTSPMKGGEPQKGIQGLPGQLALDQQVSGGPPRAAGNNGGSGGIFPGLGKRSRGI